MYFKTLILLSILFAHASIAGDAIKVPLTEKQKQKIFAEFKKYNESKGPRVKKDALENLESMSIREDQKNETNCNNSASKEEFDLCLLEIELSNRYMEESKLYSSHLSEGRYDIGLYFLNDNNFNLKVVGGEYTGTLTSDEFRTQSQLILAHYLGDLYEENSPKIMIVKPNRVGIQIFLRPDELEFFLEDARLYHVSTPANSEVVTSFAD